VSLAEGLNVPWALAFLPDGSAVFTERPGNIRFINPRGEVAADPLYTVEGVAAVGEGGLLGIAVHPDFTNNHFIYVYHTYEAGSALANRVVRYRLDGMTLVDRTVIMTGIPGASIHDGGRLKFGPDVMLYITTGDASMQDQAQDMTSLAGKILRVKDDGSVPADNPFPGSPVYSYGHRNPQGLAWDDQGRMWEVEHGSTATDELNLIQPGKNYGWPVIRGSQTATGMETPLLNSGSGTWAPSGLAFANGSLYFVGLRGEGLFRATVRGADVKLVKNLSNFGRLREVVAGPDGLLYIFTNNRDGRGSPSPDDDRLLRVDPARL
jgi:glucose/arabinose dehydrogenase